MKKINMSEIVRDQEEPNHEFLSGILGKTITATFIQGELGQQPSNQKIISKNQIVFQSQKALQPEQQSNVRLQFEDPILIQENQLTNQTNKIEQSQEEMLPSNRQIKTMKSIKKKQNNKKMQLKSLVLKQKTNEICKKFIEKIKRNNIYSEPVHFNGFQTENSDSFFNRKGFGINSFLDNGIALVSVIQIVSLLIIYSLNLVFTQLTGSDVTYSIQNFSLCFYLFQIGYNCFTVKYDGGRKMSTYKQILRYYLSHGLMVDLLSLIILIIDFTSEIRAMSYIRLFIVFKLSQCLQKIQKLEAVFIKNYYYEQYWCIAKVFLFNFCVAHILAIFLTAMVSLDSQHNWHIAKGIQKSSWHIQYIWAYYWGANIMLTVGFGDIHANTHQEAICLVLIEFVSVICLAYNVSWVGTLIGNIRAQDLEKGKNFKTFKQLADKHKLQPQLEQKINNYIEESVNIRKKFNIQQENNFLDKLPQDLKTQYKKESNRSIFEHLPFFSSLVNRTIDRLSQKIQMTISHPDATIRKLDDDYSLLILGQGKVGFTAKKPNCDFNHKVMDSLQVKDKNKPFLLGQQFLTQKRPSYQIKALYYSVIFHLGIEELLSTLRQSTMDFMHFCVLRDKNRSILDQFEVMACELCKNNKKHTKFSCPKLHFMPLAEHVIHKQQSLQKIRINKRVKERGLRVSSWKSRTLHYYKQLKQLVSQNKNQNSENNQQQSNRTNVNKSKKNNEKTKKLKTKKAQYTQSKSNDTLLKQAPLKQQAPKQQHIILKDTAEMIKQEFIRINKSNTHQDEVWIVECDLMKNYKDYFPQSNPSHLDEISDLRIQKMKQHAKDQPIIMLQNYGNSGSSLSQSFRSFQQIEKQETTEK